MSDKYAPGHFDGDGCTFPDSGHFAESDALCGRPSGDEWECRASKDHAEGMHVWGQTDAALLFHSGWSERKPTLRLPVRVDRETALRLLRDTDAGARYAASLTAPIPPEVGAP